VLIVDYGLVKHQYSKSAILQLIASRLQILLCSFVGTQRVANVSPIPCARHAPVFNRRLPAVNQQSSVWSTGLSIAIIAENGEQGNRTPPCCEHGQQFIKLPPRGQRVVLSAKQVWGVRRDSNPQRAEYRSAVLPIELPTPQCPGVCDPRRQARPQAPGEHKTGSARGMRLRDDRLTTFSPRLYRLNADFEGTILAGDHFDAIALGDVEHELHVAPPLLVGFGSPGLDHRGFQRSMA
jgi:hypothetical protein